MLAQKLAKPWAFMTSYVLNIIAPFILFMTLQRYGRVNGLHVCENPFFLQDVLREEWGFDGIVMSDWYVERCISVVHSSF